MGKDTRKQKLINRLLSVAYYGVLFGVMLMLVLLQPFGDPPDEINRFKVAYFICNKGYLPKGPEPEILLAGYGASYAYQPILTYIIQGYLMRFLRLFTENSYVLLVAARMVNVCFGMGMAYYVKRIGEKLFQEPFFQWLFAVLIMFLPQNLFMHTYVNTDSMALFSCGLIVYAMLCGEESDYDKGSCIRMGIGVVLCAMSYYNAYGIVLSAMLLFGYHFYCSKDVKGMWKKLGLIAGIGFLGAGWWFIRNGILYQGDILGMTARRLCAMETALPEFNPLTRFTYQNAGIPLVQMFRETEFTWLSFESFYAMFGPMRIPTHGLIYIYFKRFLIVALLGLLLPVKKLPVYWENMKTRDGRIRLGFSVVLLLDILVTIGLHIYYSYTWEFQPQGRYALPMAVCLMYFVTMGIYKWFQMGTFLLQKHFQETAFAKWGLLLIRLLLFGLLCMYLLWFFYTMFNRVLPVYWQGENLLSLMDVPFLKLIE